jgi:hypothetical protein
MEHNYRKVPHISKKLSAKLLAQGKKRCPRCKQTKLVTMFSRLRRLGRDGYCGRCKECMKKNSASMRKKAADQPDEGAGERLLARARKIRSQCWIFQGPLDESGHGCFVYQGRTQLAHRAAYQIFKGEPPLGKCSYLTCRVPPCCNPDHVAFCTRRELPLELSRPNPFAINARKEVCGSGRHKLVQGENVHWYISGSGKGVSRCCLDCWREKFPGTARRPNKYEDAQEERRNRLIAELGSFIPARTPNEIREAVVWELWARWRSRAVTRRNLERETAKVLRIEWSLQPNRLGAPLSLDAELPGQEGARWLDAIPDDQESTDPLLILERLEEECVWT